MAISVNDYLSSSVIKNDSWVKSICNATTSEELAELIVKRITNVLNNGPTIAFEAKSAGKPEIPAEIIYDLASENFIDYELIDKAMAIIMRRIITKQIENTNAILENVFFIIEQLALEETSADLFIWVKQNHERMNSQDGGDKQVYLNAVNALAYAQRADEEGIEDFWHALWMQENSFWWNSAFHGIRYSNFDKAISLIPDLVERKCSNITFLLSSMWRVKDDTRLADAIKKGIRENKLWAGVAVNLLASKMKWAEKSKMIERLHDKEYVSDDDEDVNEWAWC